MARILVILAVLFGLAACKEEAQPKVDPPLEFESQKAPYAITLSPKWSREDPKTLNTHADFAASFGGNVYVIVIPQALPQFPNVEPPDSLALKRASMSVMESQVDGLSVERQGPVKVDGQLAQSVLAKGTVEKQPVKYATTYVTYQGWGFQIVGWGPAESASLVISQADEFLQGWKFRPAEKRNPDAGPDIESQPDAGD